MKLSLIFIAASFVVASVIAKRSLRVRGIYISQPDENYQSSLGIVGGVRNCGGSGHVIQWRSEDCIGEEVCHLPADGGSRPTELEFTPSQDIEALGIRLVVTEEGGISNVYERQIPHSEVEHGKRYIVNGHARTSKDLQGKKLTAQYILYRIEDNQVETCAEADFEFH